MKDLRNYSLAQHNTFGIDAKCSRFIEFSSVAEAKETVKNISDEDMPLLLLGGGSNLLLTKDFNGTVLHSAIKGISSTFIDGGVLVRCGSGETWDDVVAHCVAHGWYGTENLSLIPGEVGASAVQNIGAYGAEVKDIIYKVEAVEIATGKSCYFTNEQCEYAYRKSRFKEDWKNKYLITHVTYKLSLVFNPHLDYGNIRAELDKEGISDPTAAELRNAIIKIRDAKLPPRPQGLWQRRQLLHEPLGKQGQVQRTAQEISTDASLRCGRHTREDSGWMDDRPMRMERQDAGQSRSTLQTGPRAREQGRCHRQ